MKFKNKNGTLTAYAFACGYRELAQNNKTNTECRLWKDGCWHVRAYSFDEYKRLFWDSFDKLGDARKRFNLAVKELKLKKQQNL